MARLVASLQADPRPRLTWYGDGGDRVELTGRVLAQWVAKTAHLLLEEADVEPGSLVRVALGPDWRAPVFWLAAWYLGAAVEGPGTVPSPPDVAVVREGDDVVPGAVTVVVASAALPGPATDLPPGAVDYGGEVSAQPDQLPTPGPAVVLGVAPRTGDRALLGPDARPADLVATWAAGGSVVLHTGLAERELARVAAQERAVTP